MSLLPAPGEPESLALALVNSLHRERGRLVDDIEDDESLSRWLDGRMAVPAGLGPIDVVAVQQLRDTIRVVFEAAIAEEPVPAEAVHSVNEIAAAAPGMVKLRPDMTREWQFVGGGFAEQLLAMFARDAIQVSTTERARDLVACQAPHCVRLLLRDHNRRQWCSTKCGDRVRAARYQARRQEPTP